MQTEVSQNHYNENVDNSGKAKPITTKINKPKLGSGQTQEISRI
jgi:hypothetical protein